MSSVMCRIDAPYLPLSDIAKGPVWLGGSSDLEVGVRSVKILELN